MKNLITIIIMLVAVGCGKTEIETKTESETGKTEKKPLSPEEKLVGSYEAKKGPKFVLLENGKAELYVNGKKKNDGTWKMAGKEVHVGDEEATGVYKIEPNGDLILKGLIKDGKRKDVPKEEQGTIKKISHDAKTATTGKNVKTVGKEKKGILPEALPVVAMLNAAEASDLNGFRNAYSSEIREDKEQGKWEKNLKEAHGNVKRLLGNHKIDELTFTFTGNKENGKVSIVSKVKVLFTLQVIREGDKWKIDER